jgi:hypothetical protein
MNPQTVHRLLDKDEAASLLAAVAPAAAREEVFLESLWAKPGRHFNVCYRVGADRSDRSLASLCILDSDDTRRTLRREDYQRPRNPSCGEGNTASMVSDDILAQSFPFDYRLPHLAGCTEPRVVRSVAGAEHADTCDVVAYRPGMRCQLRYSAGPAAIAYGKTAVERDPGRRRRVHVELCGALATRTMRVPRLLGSPADAELDLVEAVKGRSLHSILRSAPDAEPVVAVMRGLAELHDCAPAPQDRVHRPADELALLESWCAWITGIDAQTGSRIRGLLTELASSVPETTPRSLAHRDFYDKQVLIDDGRQWLLDVDTACTGDRELDLGNFLAHLVLRGLQWERDAAHRNLEEIAQDAYGTGARPEVTRWYRRATLLRLAAGYILRPHWRHLVPALLEEARRS